ncbi:hypothetical protein AX761_22690 [Rhizobium sp. 58]|nr:hypothetical protein AX761_22690 [Rhizobium sp. 58]
MQRNRTPWQKVIGKFGLSQSELSRVLGCHRSKISRAINDEKGLIHGRDQEMILRAAEKAGVRVTALDMIAGG